MMLVLSFLFLFVFLIILILGVVFLKIRVSAQNLDLEVIRTNVKKAEYRIIIGLYLWGFIKVGGFTISNGVIIKAGNLGIRNFDLVGSLKSNFNIPIYIRNDAKAAAMAEKVYGSMKDYSDCVFLTLGSGIGGAVFMNGKLLEPKRYSGFEIGHMVINQGGRQCSCGKKGCFETYASIKALKTKVTETLDIDSDISGQYLREVILKEQVFEKKNEAVINDLEVFLDYLSTGICNLIDIFEPEIIALGGSFSYYEGHPVYDMLLEKIHKPNSRFNEGKSPKIVTAEFKNNAGIIGATLV